MISPIVYVAWAAIVVLSLVGTYPVDPYVFGFTALGLAWLTGALTLIGIIACLLPRAVSGAAKAVIVGSLVVAAGAIALAFRVLGGFNWA